MKTTMIMRNVANPRRTTLVHLKNADELTPAPRAERVDAQDAEAALPPQTANPRRTVLVDAPAG
ncbi:hypothetical protein V1L54_04215 [Streptomyces sp. TRM 70361]|uniref:hypothetical protein n=1 Tax=Streptomyces sp. TRM 70361 TaxID=3116553 RepID=UPI002E7B3216|nr:hypothetical protein [Streptomyces sp. TRM 70361]MEE1938621.1 hypothetical protein [Streptomyces sp. TRM 70361]